MDKYHQQQAKIRYELDNYTCQVCGKQATQLGHRISQSKVNIRLYTKQVIHHNINMVSVCNLDCNKKVNISDNYAYTKSVLIGLIKLCGNQELSTKRINEILIIKRGNK